MKAKGQTPKDAQWKAKYEEPESFDGGTLRTSPEGWRWTTLGTLLTSIEAGTSFKCDEREPAEGEVGVVKVSAVTWGRGS